MTYRVVLVDDVPEIRQILRLILEHAGPFEVVGEGCNGHDALQLAGDLQPDLIVIDVEMRGGPTGWQVLPDLRRASPGTAVVILSGSAADPMRIEREAMADGVLEKGLPPQELNDALLAILGDPRRATAAPIAAEPVDGPEPSVAAAVAARHASDAAAVLAALLDVTQDAVIELAADGRVVSWNRSAERIFGRTAADAIDLPFVAFVNAEVEGVIERSVGGARIDAVPVEIVGNDGQARPVALSLAPVPGGAVAIVHDASATQASGQAMALAVAELEAKRREVEGVRRELEGFASVASHDIAQPLQVAYGYLEMVRTEFAEGMDETAASWIDAAVGSLERMRLLVQDILAYARGGNREIEPRPVSVEDAARSALAAVENHVQERAAEVKLREPLPTVVGHDEHLANVLERLLDNAVRFVPPDRAPIVEVFADEEPDEWIITVADNGAGIPPELADRVFDVFYRGAKTTNSGTGLGLSLSRKLVDRMGGRIWVESRPGEADGTWIRFALPKAST